MSNKKEEAPEEVARDTDEDRELESYESNLRRGDPDPAPPERSYEEAAKDYEPEYRSYIEEEPRSGIMRGNKALDVDHKARREIRAAREKGDFDTSGYTKEG